MYIIKYPKTVSRRAILHARSFWSPEKSWTPAIQHSGDCRDKSKTSIFPKDLFSATCHVSLDLFFPFFLAEWTADLRPSASALYRSLSHDRDMLGLHHVAKWILFSLIGGFRRNLSCDLVAPGDIHKGLTVDLFLLMLWDGVLSCKRNLQSSFSVRTWSASKIL